MIFWTSNFSEKVNSRTNELLQFFQGRTFELMIFDFSKWTRTRELTNFDFFSEHELSNFWSLTFFRTRTNELLILDHGVRWFFSVEYCNFCVFSFVLSNFWSESKVFNGTNKSLQSLTWICVRRCGKMRFRRESGEWRQWGWRVWVVCTGCTAAAAAQPSSTSSTSPRWHLQQPHPWSLLSCWFHFVSCEGCSNIIANMHTLTNNSVANYSDRFSTTWFMLFELRVPVHVHCTYVIIHWTLNNNSRHNITLSPYCPI